MLKKIESLIITTENYNETMDFFERKLELAMPANSDEMARFELGGFRIFVAKNDIEADFQRLKENGIEFYEPISVLKSGDRASFFKGPAGIEFMLYQPADRAE
jgi:predicted enzyme related to lactoylglutathione lyase